MTPEVFEGVDDFRGSGEAGQIGSCRPTTLRLCVVQLFVRHFFLILVRFSFLSLPTLFPVSPLLFAALLSGS